MNKKPTVSELTSNTDYELLAAVDHARIKDFVLGQVMKDRKLIPAYMVYQTLLFLAAMFFLSRSVVLAIRGDSIYLIYTVGAIFFSLTFLVLIHELLHGLALKIAGAVSVRYGMVPGKFIFYAEADQFVLGKKPFLCVAFTPLIVVQLVTILLIIGWFSHPFVFFPVIVMCIHSFFCAGDVALVTLFYRFPGHEVFTFDSHEEKTSYYYIRKEVS